MMLTARLLTLTEAAAVLRVSRATAYKLIHTGELPAIRVGGVYRVHSAELEALVQRPAGRENGDGA
jgi:excisionase family DNA binding protein